MAKIIKYDDGTFVVRKFNFDEFSFICLTNQNDNYWWWSNREEFREHFIFHSKEAAQYRWERYKNRNKDKKKNPTRTIIKKWKLK